MEADTDVTGWFGNALRRDPEAEQKRWHHYFPQLVRLAGATLPPPLRRVRDAEDLALSAENLWAHLSRITRCKVLDQYAHQFAQKRGGLVRGDSALAADDSGFEPMLSREPTPEMAAILAEEVQTRLAGLDEGLRRIALWKMEGYSNEEIAVRLNCRADTVSRKLGRIRDLWSAENPS